VSYLFLGVSLEVDVRSSMEEGSDNDARRAN
jgi:hypothetical protein